VITNKSGASEALIRSQPGSSVELQDEVPTKVTNSSGAHPLAEAPSVEHPSVAEAATSAADQVAALDEVDALDEVEGITLFSVANNLQTSLLSTLIAQQTKLPCVVEADYTRRITHISLAVVDCQGRSRNALRKLVENLQNHPSELRVVLLNACAEGEQEELLDWPCIVGVFFDDTDQAQLTRGLQCLLGGEYWVPRRLLHDFLQKNRRAPSPRKLDIKLTKRERQILKLIKNGATNSDIANALEVTEHTVKSHLYNVYKKIGVRNRLEANNWVRDMDSL
jgi:DNA-binding NarL/FixJ family response regulator